jgi:hypothetical protein
VKDKGGRVKETLFPFHLSPSPFPVTQKFVIIPIFSNACQTKLRIKGVNDAVTVQTYTGRYKEG